MTQQTITPPAQSVAVHHAADLRVTSGANLGDCLSFADDLGPGDIYQLQPRAKVRRLSFVADDDRQFTVADDSPTGAPGARLCPDSCLTFMAANGETAEIVILVEVDGGDHAATVLAVPLVRLAARTDYALVGIDRGGARRRLAEMACVSFARATHITLASGEQRAIESLQIGDSVLTRDAGAQRVRWIGQSTMRAVGDFAPVLIRAGALNNSRDLWLSPEHRLFIYQRADALGIGRPEVLVRARHLVNGTTVLREAGGFVDYYQLLFDTHQIVYAEGIAAETLLIDPRTRPALPQDVGMRLAQRVGRQMLAPNLDYEVGEPHLDRPDMADILRRASTRASG